MASDPNLPDLLESDALMRYLQDGLQHIEAGQGFADAEARGLLLQLQQQTNVIQALTDGQQQHPQLTDIQLAQQIESVDAQLAQLEAALGSADETTKQLLGQSASKWIAADNADIHSVQQQSSLYEPPAACETDGSPERQGRDAGAGGQPAVGSSDGDGSKQQQPHSNNSSNRSSYDASRTDNDEGTALLVAEAAAAVAVVAAAAVEQQST